MLPMLRVRSAKRSRRPAVARKRQGWLLCGFAARIAACTRWRSEAAAVSLQLFQASYAGPRPALNTPSRLVRMVALTQAAIPVKGPEAGLNLAMTIIDNLTERKFAGLQTGAALLEEVFGRVDCYTYPDSFWAARVVAAATDWAARHGVVYTDCVSLARQSVVLSLHVPLTPETKHMVRHETIAVMKPTAILVNVSRGQLIDTAALIQALKSRRIGGVALDV